MQRWTVIQHELLPELRNDVGALTPKLERVIHVLEWVRIEQIVSASWCGTGRPPHERSRLANAFVAKAVLGLTTTIGLIERLVIDRALRRIRGCAVCRKLPSEATFSRVFDAFAQGRLAQRVHEVLIKNHLGDELIGHISRDGTAIEAREHSVRKLRWPTRMPRPRCLERNGDGPGVAIHAPPPKNLPCNANANANANAGRCWRTSRPCVIGVQSAMPKNGYRLHLGTRASTAVSGRYDKARSESGL